MALSADDDLPVPLRLLLRYRVAPERIALAHAVEQALAAFPHLTGEWKPRGGVGIIAPWEGDSEPMVHEIVGDGGETETSFAAWQRRYFPREEGNRLFSLTVTREPCGGAWLGFCVSHRALDGTGLGWFFAHMGAAIRGFPAPDVRHDRECLASVSGNAGGIPDGYGEADGENEERELSMAEEPLAFFLTSKEISDAWGGMVKTKERFYLTHWLCAAMTAVDSSLDRVAVWCNARSRHGVPMNYTGNAGCYMPLDPCADLRESMAALATSAGVRKTAEIYRTLRHRRGIGKPLAWQGFGKGFIQCNLVPAPSAVADLGTGAPAWGVLLSRNSAGLRVTPSADQAGWIVECSFDAVVLEGIRERVEDAFPGAIFWNGGRET